VSKVEVVTSKEYVIFICETTARMKETNNNIINGRCDMFLLLLLLDKVSKEDVILNFLVIERMH
jgi:hypothetical protein